VLITGGERDELPQLLQYGTELNLVGLFVANAPRTVSYLSL